MKSRWCCKSVQIPRAALEFLLNLRHMSRGSFFFGVMSCLASLASLGAQRSPEHRWWLEVNVIDQSDGGVFLLHKNSLQNNLQARFLEPAIPRITLIGEAYHLLAG